MAKTKAKNDKDDKKRAPKAAAKNGGKASAVVPSTNGASANGVHPKPAARMSKEEFEKELARLQVELVKMQEWVKATGAKIMVVFEGRDTAGKGGVIKAITMRTNARVFRVVALP